MTTDLHRAGHHSPGAALLWLAPAAIVASAALALLPGPAPLSMPTDDPPARVPVAPATPVVEDAAWQIDHAAVDWAALDAEPDPSPMSVAAYGD